MEVIVDDKDVAVLLINYTPHGGYVNFSVNGVQIVAGRLDLVLSIARKQLEEFINSRIEKALAEIKRIRGQK